MIEGLKPYAQYTDSGLTTIGVLPNHWQILRAKTLFREIDDRSVTGKETLLSVSHISGVRRRSETNANMFLAKSNIGYKRCRASDLVINTMWAWMGALGVSHLSGIVSPAYAVYRPLGNSNLLPAYAEYLLRAPAYVAEYTLRSSGIHSSRLRLYPEHFLRIPLVVPPADEQASIVRFLDHANRRIDRFIRAKKKLIALLNEQKQAIIHRAVTRGLDPNVPMNKSGMPWVGEIPAHWEMQKLKHLSLPVGGIQMGPFGASLTTLQRTETGFKLFGQENTISGDFNKGSRWLTEQQFIALRRYEIRSGDLVLTRKGSIGKCRLVPEGISIGVADSDTIRLRLKYSDMPKFIEILLHDAPYIQWQIQGTQRGAVLGGLNTSTISQLLIAVPPRDEQRSLLQHIYRETSKIEQSIGAVERNITLIRAYRIRLIADVVTGQLDVRDAVNAIPVEDADGGEPVDAGDEIDEAEIDDSEQDEAA